MVCLYGVGLPTERGYHYLRPPPPTGAAATATAAAANAPAGNAAAAPAADAQPPPQAAGGGDGDGMATTDGTAEADAERGVPPRGATASGEEANPDAGGDASSGWMIMKDVTQAQSALVRGRGLREQELWLCSAVPVPGPRSSQHLPPSRASSVYSESICPLALGRFAPAPCPPGRGGAHQRRRRNSAAAEPGAHVPRRLAGGGAPQPGSHESGGCGAGGCGLGAGGARWCHHMPGALAPGPQAGEAPLWCMWMVRCVRVSRQRHCPTTQLLLPPCRCCCRGLCAGDPGVQAQSRVDASGRKVGCFR